MRFKYIIALVLILIAAAGVMVNIIESISLMIKNPDMTNMRRLLEYPEPVFYGVLFLIIGWVGFKLLLCDNERK